MSQDGAQSADVSQPPRQAAAENGSSGSGNGPESTFGLGTAANLLETKKSNLLLSPHGFEEIKEVDEEYNAYSSKNLNSGETYRRQRLNEATPDRSDLGLGIRNSWHSLPNPHSGSKAVENITTDPGFSQDAPHPNGASVHYPDGEPFVRRGMPYGKENCLTISDKKSADSASKMCFSNFRKPKAALSFHEQPKTAVSGPPKAMCPSMVSHPSHSHSIGHQKHLPQTTSHDSTSLTKPSRKSPQIDVKRRLQHRILSPSENKILLKPQTRDTAAALSLSSVSSPNKKDKLRIFGLASSMSIKKSRKRISTTKESAPQEDEKAVDLRLFRNSISGTELREQLSNSTLDGVSKDASKVSWFLRRSSKKAV